MKLNLLVPFILLSIPSVIHGTYLVASQDDSTVVDNAPRAAAACPPDINDATVDLLKEFEVFAPRPKPDPSGIPTVGFGHLCRTSRCSEVPFQFPLTEDTATQLLQRDAKTFAMCVNSVVSSRVRLNDNQFGALVAFTFKLGCGVLRSSTLLKRLNAGEDPNTVASEEIIKFNKSGGKVLPALDNRRKAEIALFTTPSDVIAHPC